MNRSPSQSRKTTSPSRLPLRDAQPTEPARKSRALRPALEACEARTLLSTAALSKVIEPLQFSAVTAPKKGASVQVAGTLQLTQGPKGGLAGTLVESDGATLPVRGSLHGQRIDLNVRVAPGQVVHVVGPVVSAKTAGGQTTLHGGGLILAGGNRSQGTFTLRGSDVVLPEGRLQNPRNAPRLVAAGTTLVPTHFLGVVRQGENARATLFGTLSLGRVGRDGGFSGTLDDVAHGAVPVSGRVVGDQIQLSFDLGPKGKFGGVGPFVAEKVGAGQVKLTSFGSLQTGNASDSGDWAVTGSTTGVDLTSADLTDASLSATDLTYATLTDSILTGTDLTDANLTEAFADPPDDLTAAGVHTSTVARRRVDLSGANLDGANLEGVSLRRLNAPPRPPLATGQTVRLTRGRGANLANADMTDAELSGFDAAPRMKTLSTGTVMVPTRLSGADLTGARLIGADLTKVNASALPLPSFGDPPKPTNLSGADLSKAKLTGANLSDVIAGARPLFTSTGAQALVPTKLSGADLSGANLARADLSGINASAFQPPTVGFGNPSAPIRTDLSGADLSGAILIGADLTSIKASPLPSVVVGGLATVTSWRGADMSGAKLMGADLSKINASPLSLPGGPVLETKLSGADLTGAKLMGADLRKIDASPLPSSVPGSPSRPTNLSGADLTGANLAGANLTGAILTGATLTNAKFGAASLIGTGLTRAYLTSVGATFDSLTLF